MAGLKGKQDSKLRNQKRDRKLQEKVEVEEISVEYLSDDSEEAAEWLYTFVVKARAMKFYPDNKP